MIGDHEMANDKAGMTVTDETGLGVRTETEALTEAREVIMIDHVTTTEEETIAIAAVVNHHGKIGMISGTVGISHLLMIRGSLERIRHTALTTSGLQKKETPTDAQRR